MLDIHFIREHKDLVKAGALKKHIDIDIDKLLELDDARKDLQKKVDEYRAEQNSMNSSVANASPEERASLIAKLKEIKEAREQEEAKLKKVLHDWQLLMLQVPNVPDVSVPEGKDDADNVEVRVWGDKPSIENPKSHYELLAGLNGVDLERGVKVSGFRGYFMTGVGAELTFALWRFALDFMNEKHADYTHYIVPSLVRRESFMGTGYLPQSEDDLYKTQDDEYLSGTAEVATMGYFMDDVLTDLPKKVFSFSPCFRREAGSHGKDTKGLIRVHEFYKFEQVIICEASHEQSVAFHEELLANAEEFMQALKIPYHVVVNAGGDLGLGQVKKYDVEAWVPSEGKYRETHSASYFHDFQTRRLNIKYKDAAGKMQFAHSLNSTLLPTPRLLVSLIENNQQPDGSVKVPEVLVPYMKSEVLHPHEAKKN